MLILLPAPIGQPQGRVSVLSKIAARRRSARLRAHQAPRHSGELSACHRPAHRAGLAYSRHPDGPPLRAPLTCCPDC